MSPLPRQVIGGILVVASAIGVAWLSRMPYRFHGDDRALIRLAWSARPERIETCRRPSEEELARLPAHMREREVCEGTSARYRLQVIRDRTVVLDEIVRGAGLRHDRPVYLLRDLPTMPGPHQLEVRFERIDSVGAAVSAPAAEPEVADTQDGGLPGRERHEAEEHRRRRLESVPPALSLADTLALRPREVLLITYQPESRSLITIRAP
jgi:hypothetical protein